MQREIEERLERVEGFVAALTHEVAELRRALEERRALVAHAPTVPYLTESSRTGPRPTARRSEAETERIRRVSAPPRPTEAGQTMAPPSRALHPHSSRYRYVDSAGTRAR